MPPSPEFAIVGQGLAGTTLAWHLMRRGRSVVVLDDDRSDSASRVAAGLITPVTGKRLVKSWRWDELSQVAFAFYRATETATGANFFHPQPSLRLFADETELAEFQRRERTVLRGLVRPMPTVNPEWFAAPQGGFEMPDAARLDVLRYLDASRAEFRARGVFYSADVTSPESLDAGTVVLCRGYAPEPEPWFGAVRFNAAKGEILTVRIAGFTEDRVVHRGIWLVPAGRETFHVGATHTWERLDAVPTAEGRAEIEAKLRAFLKLPYEVIGHRAAVRPVIDAGSPALGRHPAKPRLAYFNGLGTKGSLLAPFFANQLAAYLCGEGGIDPAVDVSRFLIHPRSGVG